MTKIEGFDPTDSKTINKFQVTGVTSTEGATKFSAPHPQFVSLIANGIAINIEPETALELAAALKVASKVSNGRRYDGYRMFNS